MPLGARKKAEEAKVEAAISDENSKLGEDSLERNNGDAGEEKSEFEGKSSDDVDSLRMRIAALRKSSESEVKSLKDELTAGRVELASLRRNHQANIKRIEKERDMFAAELAREQGQGQSGTRLGRKGSAGLTGSTNKVEELEAQLRAVRTRNSDLEEENKTLRQENKEAVLRLQATKTLSAESGAYDKIVADLVDIKLKLALSQEENEELSRSVKTTKDSTDVMKKANGNLEKSRQEWVVKCAAAEKEKAALQQEVSELNKKMESMSKGGFPSPRLSNELQQIPL